MNIYISDIEKKEEISKFMKYWEEKWYPTFIDSIYDYCVKTDGQIVNLDLAERISEDYLSSYEAPPIINECFYQESVVTIKPAGIFWHNRVLGGTVISNLSDLVSFFHEGENQKKYILEDSEGTISLSDLSDRINSFQTNKRL